MNFAALLTWYSVAPHSSIFTVRTVVNSNPVMCTVSQACLSPVTAYLVIVDWTTACTKIGFSQCRSSSTVIELLADHIGIIDAPTVITHSAPCTIVVHLHTPFTVRGTSHQSDCSICCTREHSLTNHKCTNAKDYNGMSILHTIYAQIKKHLTSIIARECLSIHVIQTHKPVTHHLLFNQLHRMKHFHFSTDLVQCHIALLHLRYVHSCEFQYPN